MLKVKNQACYLDNQLISLLELKSLVVVTPTYDMNVNQINNSEGNQK